MTLVRRAISATLLALLVAAALAACKSPPRHTDSTRGTTKQDRDTGMHDGQM